MAVISQFSRRQEGQERQRGRLSRLKNKRVGSMVAYIGNPNAPPVRWEVIHRTLGAASLGKQGSSRSERPRHSRWRVRSDSLACTQAEANDRMKTEEACCVERDPGSHSPGLSSSLRPT